SAGLAKQLRLRLEALLPATLGRLAEALQAARERLGDRFPDPASRRRALDAALAQGGPLDPLADGTADRVEAWLGDLTEPRATGLFELVLTSDDPDDLTLREARLLGTADVLLVEPGVASAIVARARADAVRRPWPHEGPPPPGLVVVLRRG